MPPIRTHATASFNSVDNLAIFGATFTEIHGNYNEVHGCESGLLALSQAISHGAIYDSAERYPAGRCHPGTREEIITTILDWINTPNPPCDVLWLYGPAGAGKSAIMQTIAENLREKYKDRYAGSFFFAASVPERNEGSALFSTLAYQIATNITGMRKPVSEAMSTDPTLPTKSIDTQIKSLIIEPFAHCPCPPAHTPTIIIDGLDECRGPDTQRGILDLIARARTIFRAPLRFLIASRPEYSIRDKFDRHPLVDITQGLELNDSRQTSQDIRKFFEDGFAEILDKSLDIMTYVEKPWPPTKTIDHLVTKASGQFVYASTVLKFISAEFCNPQSQFDIICTPGPMQASAFSDLDHLYSKILSVYPRPETLLRVLGGILVYANLTTIEMCLGVERGEINLIVRALSSLIRWETADIILDQDVDLELIFGRPEPRPSLTFFHLSFQDYLVDRNRSGPFFVDIQDVEDKLFNLCHDMIIGCLRGVPGYCDEVLPYSNETREYLVYSAEASPSLVVRYFEDLVSAMQQCKHDKSRIATQPKLLLRQICYAWSLVENQLWRDIDFSLMMTIPLGNTQEEMIKFQDECFRQILSSTTSSFLKVKNIPYFMTKWGYQSLHELSDLLKLDEKLTKKFLIENSALFSMHFLLVKLGQGTNSFTKIAKYEVIGKLNGFLSSASRGGIFHNIYRKQFIGLIQESFDFLDLKKGRLSYPDDCNLPTATYQLEFFRSFLTTNDISDIKYAEDEDNIHNLQLIINRLCNWTELEFPNDHCLGPEIEVIKWIHRQLNQSTLPPLLADNNYDLAEKYLQIMSEIYESRVLPEFLPPYFSHDHELEHFWLSCISFPPLYPQEEICISENTIPPYNTIPLMIFPQINRDRRISLLGGLLTASSEITKIMEEAIYNVPLIMRDKCQCYTNIVEFFLITYATYIHYNFTFDSNYLVITEIPLDFVLWFSHANSSKKILVGLWTLSYVSTRINKWRPPKGFCSGAMDYLKKYAFDPEGELQSWLENLIKREKDMNRF